LLTDFGQSRKSLGCYLLMLLQESRHAAITSSTVQLILPFALSRCKKEWLATLSSGCGLDLLERRLVNSLSAVIIPFDDRIFFVSSFNCPEFSIWPPEIAQPFDAISGSQF
jgi:hypothetical protein